MPKRLGWTLAAVAALMVSVPAGAHARREKSFDYRFEQVWSAAIRLVRVDYGFPIRDKDEEVGYLLFDYRSSHGEHAGSIEVVRRDQPGHKRIGVVVKVPKMPSYIERMMLDKLQKKLERDFGEPLPPRRERKGRSDGKKEAEEPSDRERDDESEEGKEDSGDDE